MINTNKLKGRIIEAGYTQISLAEAVGMSVNALNAKINGRASFNCDEADALCSLLGIESSDEKVDIFLPSASHKWDNKA